VRRAFGVAAKAWALGSVVAAVTFATRLARADEEAPSTGVVSSPAPARNGSAFVDPLGFLMFGPRVGVEAGGNRLTGAVYGRWFDGGLLSHSLFLREGDDFAFSWGAGLRGRYYFSEGQSGIHAGAGAEYIRTRIETPGVLIAANSTYLVGYVEGGYRLPLGRFYAGLAAALGYAARLSAEVVNLPGGNAASSYAATNKSSIYGTGSLELGVFF
jgi:hypothetical protein